jgi:hypothetical protein
LSLKNIRRRKICGIDAVVATDFVNEAMGGITDYYLEVKGGEINFEYRPELGMYVFDMLDTDRNREFLATHLAGDFWEILDKRVETDVIHRAELIAARLREAPQKSDAPNQFWKEVHASEEQARRAARGEIDIPPATIPQQNPVDPRLPLLQTKYEPPVREGKEGFPKGMKRGPSLWKGKTNEERQAVTADRTYDIQNVPHETPRLGVGVVAP